MNELINSLLSHIEEAYPKGGFLYVHPQAAPCKQPSKRVASPIQKVKVTPKALAPVPALPKGFPGMTLHSLPPTPILIVHGGEAVEELALLERLSAAFSKKRIASQVVSASSVTPTLLKSPLVKVVALTPQAAQALAPLTTHAKTHVMEAPKSLITNPNLRQPLWSALCALL